MNAKLLIKTTCACLLISACAQEPIKLQTGENAEVNKAGLVKVENSFLKASYAKAGTDWKKYHKIYFSSVKATNDHPSDYKAPRINRAVDGPKATYDVSEEGLVKLADEFKEMASKVFDSEQPFELVDKAGPNTLVVEAVITDIRLSAPTEESRRNSVTGKVFTRNPGTLVLLAQITDGETGELLAQAADRPTPIDQWTENNKMFNISELRTIYRTWLNNFKKALMEVTAEEDSAK